MGAVLFIKALGYVLLVLGVPYLSYQVGVKVGKGKKIPKEHRERIVQELLDSPWGATLTKEIESVKKA